MNAVPPDRETRPGANFPNSLSSVGDNSHSLAWQTVPHDSILISLYHTLLLHLASTQAPWPPICPDLRVLFVCECITAPPGTDQLFPHACRPSTVSISDRHRYTEAVDSPDSQCSEFFASVARVMLKAVGFLLVQRSKGQMPG